MGFLDQGIAEFLVGQIAGHAVYGVAFAFQQVADPVGVFFLFGKVVDADLCPFAGIGDGNCATDPRIATGDQCLAVLQAAEALIAVLAMICFWLHLVIEPWLVLRLLGEGRLWVLRSWVTHVILGFDGLGHGGLFELVCLNSTAPRPTGSPHISVSGGFPLDSRIAAS